MVKLFLSIAVFGIEASPKLSGFVGGQDCIRNLTGC
jgi:hypothetical protein